MLDQSSAARLAGRDGVPSAPHAAAPVADSAVAVAPPGVEHLLFTCRTVPCAVPLGALREVVRAVPSCVALPFSPPWLLGVFAHRTELVGLVDPAPLLLGAPPRPVDPSAPPAAATLIAGHDDQLLGLAVAALGEIVVIRPGEIVAAPGGPTNGAAVAPPFLRGRYQPPSAATTAACAVVDLEPFVAALLAALRDEADHG